MSFIFNIYHIVKYIRNIIRIEDKTYNELQNYLNTSKPDKLFKRYYDYFEFDYSHPKNPKTIKYEILNDLGIKADLNSKDSENSKIQNQIITVEFNENYKNYHAGKACMSDIINNLNYSFKDLMKIEEQPKLNYSFDDKKWYFGTINKNIDLSKELFNNIVINLHINYIDLNQIAKTIKIDDLYNLSEIFKHITLIDKSKYIIYDIYENKFIVENIDKIKTWNDYINYCLNIHYNLINNLPINTNNDISEIITKFNKISRKYNWMFDNKTNSIYLYNKSNNKMALPNPDGLIVNGCKMV
jgi:hypothetical protein